MFTSYLIVTTFSDYGGLFQIKSNNDDATTVGTPLEYGQVFKLVTVQVCATFVDFSLCESGKGHFNISM